MGYDGVFFVRIDYQDKDIRLDNQTAELVWHGSPNLGASSDIYKRSIQLVHIARWLLF